MKHTYDRQIDFVGNTRQALQVATTDNETLFKIIMDTFQERDRLRSRASALTKELDDALQLRSAYNANVNDWRELCSYFNLPVSELSAVLNAIETMRKERDDYRMECNTLRAISTTVTHDPRYIVHGHVQPCVVLYIDETTTLIRLDNEDMMCETDTIQWSDALTYRCQELLASAGLERGSMSAQRVLPVLAELVRDERVTLNDEGVAVEQPDFVAPIA